MDRRDLAVVFEPSASIRSADPRRDILEALVRTIALRGYDRTTIDRVLLAAEVPAPVFDEHFEDKQDCLLAALDELIARIEGAISERIDSAACWSERVLIGLETLLAAFAGYPDGARVALVECLGAGEEAIARVRSAIARTIPVLEGGRRGESDAEASALDTTHLPAQTSEAVAGGIASILHRRVLEGHTSELPALLPDLLYFALMPYLGHERALAASESASARAA
ncbi:MAG: TetR/AcrR family transcriptional regulator [Solirubrobacteraceae bacterium]